jgi:hypothetical protein
MDDSTDRGCPKPPLDSQAQELDALCRGEIRDYTGERHVWLDEVSWEELITQAQALDVLRRGEK